MDPTTIDPVEIAARVAAIQNLAEFARDYDLPIRTLRRIKASALAQTEAKKKYAPVVANIEKIAKCLARHDKLEKRRMARAAKASKPKGKK